MKQPQSSLIQKTNHGGNKPVEPETGLLVFLWYLGKGDTLLSIGDRFNITESTVNNFLYIILKMQNIFIVTVKIIKTLQKALQHILVGLVNL